MLIPVTGQVLAGCGRCTKHWIHGEGDWWKRQSSFLPKELAEKDCFHCLWIICVSNVEMRNEKQNPRVDFCVTGISFERALSCYVGLSCLVSECGNWTPVCASDSCLPFLCTLGGNRWQIQGLDRSYQCGRFQLIFRISVVSWPSSLSLILSLHLLK